MKNTFGAISQHYADTDTVAGVFVCFNETGIWHLVVRHHDDDTFDVVMFTEDGPLPGGWDFKSLKTARQFAVDYADKNYGTKNN